LIGKEVGDKIVGEQILYECRKIKGPVLIHKGPIERNDMFCMGFQLKPL
jgi:hypothetical protein